MSIGTSPPPQQLRPLLHEKIDQLTDVELAAVHKQLLILELRREFDGIGGEMARDWNEGRITRETVDEAVRKYRTTHHHATPDRP
jgi:hypothetical protein